MSMTDTDKTYYGHRCGMRGCAGEINGVAHSWADHAEQQPAGDRRIDLGAAPDGAYAISREDLNEIVDWLHDLVEATDREPPHPEDMELHRSAAGILHAWLCEAQLQVDLAR